MENVQFNEAQYGPRVASTVSKPSLLARTVIGTGLAKDEAGAQKALLGVLVAVVVIIIFVLWTQFGGSVESVPDPIMNQPL